MSATTIKLKSKVLPGKQVIVTASDLIVGEDIDVLISRPAICLEDSKAGLKSMAEIIASIPPSNRTAEEWKEREKSMQEEKNSWDR